VTQNKPVILILSGLALTLSLVSVAQADVVLEGVHAARCNESDVLRLPRKMTLYQTIAGADFEAFESVSLILWTGFTDRFDLNEGKVIATATQIKADGTEIRLGRLARPFKNGQANKEKAVAALLEPGDLIVWDLKLKQLPPLEIFLECWLVELDIGGAQMLQ